MIAINAEPLALGSGSARSDRTGSLRGIADILSQLLVDYDLDLAEPGSSAVAEMPERELALTAMNSSPGAIFPRR